MCLSLLKTDRLKLAVLSFFGWLCVAALLESVFQYEDLNICLNRSLFTSSSSTGMPIRMAFSKVRRKFGSVSLMTFRPAFPSLERIHRFAWE